MAAANAEAAPGKGFALTGLVIGLLTGFAAYGVIEYWIDGHDDRPLAITALCFIATWTAGFLLLAGKGAYGKAALGALAIAALLALPDLFIARTMAREPNFLTEFPVFFWFFISRGLAGYLLVTLVKAGFESGVPPAYSPVFFHGLTLPLISACAGVFSGLALVLLFTWARLLKELDVEFFNKVFQEPWFLLPFLGAIGGLSIALMRGQQAVLGALRFTLLLLARILMVITAVFTVTLIIVLAAKGAGVVLDRPYPAALMIGLALAGMLIFNGVYQNGEAAPPPFWLRIPTLVTLIGFPVYALIALYAFYLRIDAYGLTPPRIAGIALNGLVAAYSLVCLAGLVSEANWRAKRWMAPVGPLNTIMAAVWIAVLILIATPLFNPWAVSAKSQYALLAKGRVAAEDFDFGYLRFELGSYGEHALDRLLALENHPEAGAIRAGVAAARAAPTYWNYQHPEIAPAEEAPLKKPAPDGPETLPLNPGGSDEPESETF